MFAPTDAAVMPDRVCIDRWTIDFSARCLRNGSVEVSVSRRAIDVLQELVKAGRSTVSRSDLLDAAWPHVTVTDESLSQAISELRRAFRADGRNTKIISTVARTGYRLLEDPRPAEDHSGYQQAPVMDLRAYALILEAESALVRAESGAVAQAVECGREVVDMSPDCVQANSFYAYALSVRGLYGAGDRRDFAKALDYVRRATGNSRTSAESQAAFGYVLSALEAQGAATQKFAASIAFGDMTGEGHYLAARHAFVSGEHRLAFGLCLKTAELVSDPSRPLFLAARAARHFDSARSRTVAQRCVSALRHRLAQDPDDLRSVFTLGPALALAGELDAAWTSLSSVPDTETYCLIHLAFGYGALGETRNALDAIEKAIDEGYRDTRWLQHEATLRFLQEHPRYKRLSAQLAAA